MSAAGAPAAAAALDTRREGREVTRLLRCKRVMSRPPRGGRARLGEERVARWDAVLRHDAAMTAPDLLGDITRTPRPRASNWLVALTAAGAIAVAGAGVATATVLSSGGTQPEDVLPRSTVAMVKVDLDPAADQKVAAYRISRKFPSLKTDQNAPLTDLLKQAVDSSNEVDYAKDVEPWLGKRVAVGAVPSGGSATAVIAVQVTDRTKAEAGLKKLAASSPDEPLSWAFVDGEDYALLAPSATDVKQYAAATTHLSDNPRYGDAVDQLDGNQIVTAWVDVAASYALAPKQLKATEQPRGFVVAGVHLNPSYAEITGRAIDVSTGSDTSSAGRGKVGLVQKLPDDTTAALGVTGLGDAMHKALSDSNGALGRATDTLQESFGVTLAQDLPAALGSETALAVLGQGDTSAFVVRTRTPATDADRGVAALQRVLAQTVFRGSPDAMAQAQQVVRRTADGLAAGSDPDAVARVLKDGDLGGSGTFRKAVPDADGAGAIGYVDLQRALVQSGQDLTPEETRDTEHLEAVGMSATASDGGNGSFRLRVTFR